LSEQAQLGGGINQFAGMVRSLNQTEIFFALVGSAAYYPFSPVAEVAQGTRATLKTSRGTKALT